MRRNTVARAERWAAAGAYLAGGAFAVSASNPEATFVRRHVRCALFIHGVRLVWVGLIVGLWWWRYADGPGRERLRELGLDLSLLAIAGVPWPSSFSMPLLPWLLTPLAVTWLTSLVGFGLAIRGRSADIHAFSHADWTDVVQRPHSLSFSPEEEKRRARLARERQLERLQRSSRTIVAERGRRSEIDDLHEQVEQAERQRAYYDQLLSLGEISKRRYEQTVEDLNDQVADLKARLGELNTRRALPGTPVPGRLRMARINREAEASVESLAIVTPSGVPVFSYGRFQLDEALVAGILSAFDSLSEEVFGSRVHKTQLAHGQVLHFAHGERVVIMATFEDEPSPRQLDQLRTMLRQFEQANAGPLSRGQYDPNHLHQVEVPYRFAEQETAT
jgi:hypothetical protein